MDPRLTIVIPLKGRRLFTFRCLWHANELRLPYRFLLADGLVHEEVARRLEDSRSIFPHLDVEYVRYPDDRGFSRYWAKMADAHARVRTPYVMEIDNDDFPGFWGIQGALDFLDANPDFICARGRSVGFTVHSWNGGRGGGLSGKINSLTSNYNYKDISAATAAQRLREGGLRHGVYSAVFRTGSTARIWRDIVEIDFSDIMLQENFFALRTLTLGKVHINKKSVSKYLQAGTGISSRPVRDWANHLLGCRFTTDAHAMIERIASAAEADGADTAAIADDVRTILEVYYNNYLSAIYGMPGHIKGAVRRKWPWLVNAVQSRPRVSVWHERVALFSQLKESGADAEDILHVREELAAVERTLSPEAFAEYAGPLLSLAKSSGRREWLYI